MTIAVNTRFLLGDYLEGYGYFIQETFRRIVRNHPEHRFVFLFDRPWDPRFVFAENVMPVLVSPAARHPLLWKIWYDLRVPAVLKKYKADLFVSPDGFCSLTTSVPQCLVLHDLAYRHDASFLPAPQRLFYKRYIPKMIAKAERVLTVSEFSKRDILAAFPKTDPSKISVVYNGVREGFAPLDFAARGIIKSRYTGGKEYFLYTGSVHPRKNLVNLLKAFSLFKKRQQSQFKLVMAGRLAWQRETFTKLLSTYKYRDDVVLTGYLPELELAGLMGAAYGLVYPSLFEGFGLPVLEAMQCEVPVITSAGSSMEEIAGPAALYCDPRDPASIAEQLMRLYKDERGRRELIEKGKEAAKRFSWEKTAEGVWEGMMGSRNHH